MEIAMILEAVNCRCQVQGDYAQFVIYCVSLHQDYRDESG